MRQVGILCAAALVALQENVGKLAIDHKNAKTLAGNKYSASFKWFLFYVAMSPSFLKKDLQNCIHRHYVISLCKFFDI